MAVIVPHGQMGPSKCVEIKNAADLPGMKNKFCKKPHTCLTCKAYADTNDNQKYSTDAGETIGMTDWMSQIKITNDWTEATIGKKLLMTCLYLSQTAMKTERKYVCGMVRSNQNDEGRSAVHDQQQPEVPEFLGAFHHVRGEGGQRRKEPEDWVLVRQGLRQRGLWSVPPYDRNTRIREWRHHEGRVRLPHQ
eukprot:12288070-Heterocapsa_arctica.AAC.1